MIIQRLLFVALISIGPKSSKVLSFSLPLVSSRSKTCSVRSFAHDYFYPFPIDYKRPVSACKSTSLSLSSNEVTNELASNDIMMVNEVYATALDSDSQLENTVETYLPKMSPTLIMNLRKAAVTTPSESDEMANKMAQVGRALEAVLDTQLQLGRDLLSDLLKCGEIRKLDSAIGNAARDGRLDMAYFTVLNMNIRDAYDEQTRNEVEKSTGPFASEGEDSPPEANRFSILQHIYTRCQEEMEKTVKPGSGLLNKLLRTNDASVRANQLGHFLSPQTSVKTPDGVEIPLVGEGAGKALVPPADFVEAIGAAVRQIRDIERSGGTDRETSANLVESCRQVAIEGRLAVGEIYGTDSSELTHYEDILQPVFRPDQNDSAYSPKA